MSKVRESKFRHVYGEQHKTRFEDIKVTTATLESCMVKSNGEQAAISWQSGGGCLLIVNLQNPCRLGATPPLIRGHSGAILDAEFYPFFDRWILTASEDTTLKLWELPEGGMTEDIKVPKVVLNGHSKKVPLCQFSQSVAFLAASASYDNTLKLWDLEKQESIISFDQEQPFSLDMNIVSSHVVSTCRDKLIRIWDARQTSSAQAWQGHEGGKSQKVLWAGQNIVTTGFNKQATRQLFFWDPKNTAEPVQQMNVDNQSGVMFPFFDNDLSILYLVGKGDGNIRYYELDNGQFYFLEAYKSTLPAKGIGFIQKKSCNTLINEIGRALKLTSTELYQVSFIVPRKAEGYHADIYPDTYDQIPAQTINE